LAVLPFVNMSRDEDLEFFCDGLTESLITDLSRAIRIAVAARNSSFAYKKQTVDIRDAAAKLGVRYLIEGSVQAMGSRMRVNLQLIDSTSRDHKWADRYDRSTDDLFAAQDELCRAIVFETDASISFGAAARVQNEYSKSEDALRHVRQAIQGFSQHDHQGFIKALKEGDIATSIDPDFFIGPIFAVAARAQLVLHGWATDKDVLIEEALKICEETLARAPDAAGIYSNRGMIYLANHEFDRSIAEAKHGVDMSPDVGPARHIYARTLIAKGRFDEAFREAMTAIKLQPNVFPYFVLSLGFACLMRNQTADAVLTLQKFRELVPHATQGIAILAAALSADSRQDDASNVAASVMKIDPNLTIDDVLRPYPMEHPVHSEKLAALLRDAGFRN